MSPHDAGSATVQAATSSSPSAGPRIAELVLPILILWNLFLFVLKEQAYPLASPEVALGLAAVALLAAPVSLLALARRHVYYAASLSALTVFFIDFTGEQKISLHKFVLLGLITMFFLVFMRLRRSFYVPAAWAFGVMLATTVVITLQQPSPALMAFDISEAASDDAPPRLVHLVLDEHQGIEGFPLAHEQGPVMKDRVKRFYQERGFRLYGDAYGHYPNTFDAIPSLLNFTREPMPKQFVSGDEGAYVVTRNQYFELLHQRGYRLHVIGANYLNFCPHAGAAVVDCQNYRFSSWQAMRRLDVPLMDKTVYLLRGFLATYPRYLRMHQAYVSSWRSRWMHDDSVWSRFADAALLIPPPHTYSANSMEVIGAIWDNVSALPRGHAAFIHLMLPHFPYSFGPHCETRPVQEWEENLEHVPEGHRTVALQFDRYRLYFEQMDCVLKLLGTLFDRLQHAGAFDDSIIVVHGDHGSRLALRDPNAEAMPLSDTDMFDYFSLLYAVKRPGMEGGYDLRRAPLEDLLIDSLTLPVTVRQPATGSPSSHFAFLRPPRGTHGYVSVPYPVIPRPDPPGAKS